jgi:hypothetical protein
MLDGLYISSGVSGNLHKLAGVGAVAPSNDHDMPHFFRQTAD